MPKFTGTSKRVFGVLAAAIMTAVFAWQLGGGGGRAAAKGNKPKTSVKTAAATCKTDADCVLVPDDCCSCNQGGKQRAIAKSDQAAYETARQKRCAGTMCAEVMSQDPSCAARASCKAGACILTAATAAAPGGW